jgi:hypothetical protein
MKAWRLAEKVGVSLDSPASLQVGGYWQSLLWYWQLPRVILSAVECGIASRRSLLGLSQTGP